ncbi:hypothetical protein L9F63_021390, partial [Diploptera punctata]
ISVGEPNPSVPPHRSAFCLSLSGSGTDVVNWRFHLSWNLEVQVRLPLVQDVRP